MMIRLDVPEGPDGILTPHTYHQDQVHIGRGPQNDIRLEEEGLLPRHVTVQVSDDQGVLIPFDGADHVAVNGTPVSERTLLQPGDTIQVGGLELQFKLVPFPMPEKDRRRSWLEWLTLALVAGGVLGQVFFLVYPAVSLRREIEPARLVPTPTPIPVPTPDPATIQPDPTPTPVPLVVAPEDEAEPTSVPQTPEIDSTRQVEDLLSEANRLLGEGQPLAAEQKYKEALRLDSGFLPAKVSLARLYSEQTKFTESLRYWEQVRREAPAGSLDAMDARLEIPSLRRKIERLEREPERSTPRMPDEVPPVPTAIPLREAFPTPSTPVVEQNSPLVVERIRMERFPQSPRYDEFRILTFDLLHQPGTPAVEAGTIKIRVTFFEQAGPRVRQAEIPNPRVVLSVDRALSRSQKVEDLSAAYEVPPGQGSDGRMYYGAIIEVFVDGQEVHRAADPEFLLEFIQ